MFSAEENDLLTRVGPNTAMGNLMRRYWLPALLAEEIPLPDCPPVKVDERAKARIWIDSSYRRIRNASNNYLQDREHQKTRSYSGIKAVIPAEQDGCATESMGPIYDRTKEHLGYSDKTIIALRKVLLQA